MVELWPTDMRTGLWCDICQMPSRVEFRLATMCEHGVTLLAGAATACTGCDDVRYGEDG